MIKIVAKGVDHYVQNPNIKKHNIFLVFGSDCGRAEGCAKSLAENLGFKFDDPFTTTKINGEELAGNSGILSESYFSRAMLAGRRLIYLEIAPSQASAAAAALDAIFKGSPSPNIIIIVVGGNLTVNSRLRTQLERSDKAAALPCYPDSFYDLSRFVEQTLAKDDFTITSDAKSLLLSQLGLDRAVSVKELEKLMMFAGNKKLITFEDVLQIICDAPSFTIGQLCDLVGEGDLPRAIKKLDHLNHLGVSYNAILITMEYHFSLLLAKLNQLKRPSMVRSALSNWQPPVHFSRHQSIKSQGNIWHRETLLAALVAIGKAMIKMRDNEPIARGLVLDLFINIKELVKSKRQGKTVRLGSSRVLGGSSS